MRDSIEGVSTVVCPLCGQRDAGHFCRDRRGDYYRCGRCHLVFVPPALFPSAAQEKAEYDRHRNDPRDPGYRRFHGRLFQPLQQRLAPGSEGLDFGCGPASALAAMLREAGHRLALYDRFYAHQPEVLRREYDFITATEVVEHLHRPDAVLQQLWSSLRPGGILGLMTKLVRDREAFASWHYKNDPTHVVFFSRPTFTWLAAKWHAGVEFIGQDVILLSKATRASGQTDPR